MIHSYQTGTVRAHVILSSRVGVPGAGCVEMLVLGGWVRPLSCVNICSL